MELFIGLIIVALLVVGAISLFHKHASHSGYADASAVVDKAVNAANDVHAESHLILHDAIKDLHEDVRKLSEHGKKGEAPGQEKK
jgi:hypothetical protein